MIFNLCCRHWLSLLLIDLFLGQNELSCSLLSFILQPPSSSLQLLLKLLRLMKQSKASRLSTRSLASKRPRAWTASTRGCLRGETPCLLTPASTLSTRPCPRRPTARTPRGAPAAAATSSEGPAARRHLGRRGCLAPQPHRDPPPQKRGRG